jgi:hypothetical protein
MEFATVTQSDGLISNLVAGFIGLSITTFATRIVSKLSKSSSTNYLAVFLS